MITFGDKRVYVAGETENVPEVKALKQIDVAFLPVNNVGRNGRRSGPQDDDADDVRRYGQDDAAEDRLPVRLRQQRSESARGAAKDEQRIEVRVRELN